MAFYATLVALCCAIPYLFFRNLLTRLQLAVVREYKARLKSYLLSHVILRVETAASGKKLLAAVLPAHLPRRLCETLLVQAGLPADRKAAALSRPDRARLLHPGKAALVDSRQPTDWSPWPARSRTTRRACRT